MLQLILKLGFDLNIRDSPLRGKMKNCQEPVAEAEPTFVWGANKSLVVDTKLLIIHCKELFGSLIIFLPDGLDI